MTYSVTHARTPASVASRAPRLVALRVLLVAATATSAASAQPTSNDSAVAEALFRDARALFDGGRVAEACLKLEESQRLDPRGGTLYALALCHQRAGKTASAWAELTQVVIQSKRDGKADREQAARDLLAELEPTLSRVTVVVPPAVASTPGLELKRGDVVLGRGVWGSAVPLDPGTYTFAASAPGKQPWSTRVTLLPNADKKTVEIPPLADAPRAAATTPLPPASAPPTSPSAATEPPARSHTTAYVVGGVGAVAMLVGGYFGYRSWSEQRAARDLCPESTCTDADGVNHNEKARSAYPFAVAFTGVGLVGLGVGTYLFVRGDRATTGRARLAPDLALGAGGGRVTLGGTW